MLSSSSMILRFILLNLSATEEDDQLGCENSEKHTEWVDRGIADGWCFFGTNLVGIGQGGRICACSSQHSHNGEIIKLVLQSGNCADDQNRNDRDQHAGVNVFQSVAFDDGLPEVGSGLNSDTCQEEHKADFA